MREFVITNSWGRIHTNSVVITNERWLVSKDYGVYGSHDNNLRRDFWTELCTIRSWNSEPWLIGGYFNIVRFAEECKGGDKNATTRTEFNEIIRHLRLIDIPISDRRFTWLDMRVHPNLVRLD